MPAYYPPNYGGPKPIIEQIKKLGDILQLDPAPALGYANALPSLPYHAEGWFAIPSPSALEARYPHVEANELHCSGIRLILETMSGAPNFYMYDDPNVVASEDLRRTERTTKALSLLTQNQTGDILIVAAQLGLRHLSGRSAQEVCDALLPNEYGLDSVAVASIILNHPDRLRSFGDLTMVCAGEVLLCNCGPTASVPTVCFEMRGDFLAMGFWYYPDEEIGVRGAVTAFLPAGTPPLQ